MKELVLVESICIFTDNEYCHIIILRFLHCNKKLVYRTSNIDCHVRAHDLLLLYFGYVPCQAYTTSAPNIYIKIHINLSVAYPEINKHGGRVMIGHMLAPFYAVYTSSYNTLNLTMYATFSARPTSVAVLYCELSINTNIPLVFIFGIHETNNMTFY